MMMMRTTLAALTTAIFAIRVFAQDGAPIVYDTIHNVSTIEGTWSSGSQHVLTGAGFVNPAASTFTYPPTAGISYSFSSDGYFEEALYRFNGNGTDPRCIQGVIQWQHGTYELVSNGSIILKPFAEDGRQQVQDPCAAESNVLRQFNQTTLLRSWRIFRDLQGRNKLHLFRYDGAPFSPMFQVYQTPQMLPTRKLTNTTIGVVAQSRNQKLRKRSAAVPTSSPSLTGAAFALSAAALALSTHF
jgi:hypothetical protein